MIFDARELAQLRRLEILASKVARGQLHGEREMKRSGPGSGFREHRQYQTGDSLRQVDWIVYSKRPFAGPEALADDVLTATRPLLVGLDVDGVLAPLVDHAADAALLDGDLAFTPEAIRCSYSLRAELAAHLCSDIGMQ